MVVQGRGTSQQFGKNLFPSGLQQQPQGENRSKRKTPAHPRPEAEDLIIGEALTVGLGRIGRDRDEALVGASAEPLSHKLARQDRALNRLAGAEGFAGDDDHQVFDVELPQPPLDIGWLGDEVNWDATPLSAGRRRRQGLAQQPGSELRSADADMEHLPDRSTTRSAAQSSGERTGAAELGRGLRHLGFRALAAEGRVKGGPVFAGVDGFAGEEAATPLLHLLLLCQIEQQLEGAGIKAMARIIEAQPRGAQGVVGKSASLATQAADVEARFTFSTATLQCAPGGT